MSRIPVDPDAIRQLASLLAETGLSEIEIADKDNRIRVARAPAPGIVHVPQAAAPAAPAMPGAAQDAGVPKGAVTSPMVGVAYLAPEPGAANYVAVGQAVAAGQTLLLIEAMKTFNQIKAPSAGTVTRILVASGSPVEYGEPLMVIEP